MARNKLLGLDLKDWKIFYLNGDFANLKVTTLCFGTRTKRIIIILIYVGDILVTKIDPNDLKEFNKMYNTLLLPQRSL